MSSQLQLAIANHLNISPNQISRVEEWATVYFAVVVGKGGRFVSKKIEVNPVSKYEIFQCNGINGTEDWFVDGPESSSFYLGTFVNGPTEKQLQYFAKKVFREKAIKYGFEKECSENPFPIRERDKVKVC